MRRLAYQTDDGLHEGWDAAVFSGGRVSVGSEHEGVRVIQLDLAAWREGRYSAAGEAELIDGRTAIGWRGVCTCGWLGPLWERVTDPLEHGLAARKVFDPVPSEWADTPAHVDDAIRGEWLRHVPPRALADVRAAAEDVRKAEARLNEAVQRARGDGSSWADIGLAAGITRQSAHERWGQDRAARRLPGKRVSDMTDGELAELASAGPARDKQPRGAWDLVDLDVEAGRKDTGR